MHFLAVFFRFPRMQSIRQAVEHRQPVEAREKFRMKNAEFR